MLITTNLAYVINFEAPDPAFNLEGVENMTWNYRVIYLPKEENDDSFFNQDSFVIREVFYDDEGNIEFWSSEDASPMGETFEEICDDFDNMALAFEKPILMLSKDAEGEEELIELDDEESEEEV